MRLVKFDEPLILFYSFTANLSATTLFKSNLVRFFYIQKQVS